MARLCDPDIDMITLKGATTPEPSVRQMIFLYYLREGLSVEESHNCTQQYISAQDEICQQSLAAR